MTLSSQSAALEQTHIHWQEDGQDFHAPWRSLSRNAAPRRVVVADDRMTADAAFRLASQGTALLWRGDFQNARQLLQALARRVDRSTKGREPTSAPSKQASRKAAGTKAHVGEVLTGEPLAVTHPTVARAQATTFPHAFHLYRQAQAQRARLLGALLIPLSADYSISLRRGPDWRLACSEAYGQAKLPADSAEEGDALAFSHSGKSANRRQAPPHSVVSLRELLGIVGAHEWRKKGVEIAALGAEPPNRIHPHYGVFSPVRGEYLDLLAQAPLPPALFETSPSAQAFDIGTGTGVLAAVLARRGVARIVATDIDPQALACAQANLARLNVPPQAAVIELLSADLFPPLESHGQAALIVCNPPWLPARANAPIEYALYDEGSRMLRGFLSGLAAHLAPQGEGWLILSDLAEHLALRSRAELMTWMADAGLQVLSRHDALPVHAKVHDRSDALHAARAAELTSLWRLGHV